MNIKRKIILYMLYSGIVAFVFGAFLMWAFMHPEIGWIKF